MKFNEITGNLITLTLEGKFDVIAHGCNSFCTMGSGLAPQMAKAFGADKFPLEGPQYRGDINKLGQIDYKGFKLVDGEAYPSFIQDDSDFYVVNAYSQYNYGSYRKGGSSKPIDYEALALCLRKMNKVFAGKHIGLPLIGAGLAGGDWDTIKLMMINELTDCELTIVHFDEN